MPRIDWIAWLFRIHVNQSFEVGGRHNFDDGTVIAVTKFRAIKYR